MTTISPTRVSMYDFLYQDIQPMTSLLADVANLSIPQTKRALSAGLQAIISALLAYQQQHQSQAVSKKLFTRSAVKELRQYNAMNFATINATLYHRQDVVDAVFDDSARVIQASNYIAKKIDAKMEQVQTLLSCLCIIVLRELAILTDYSQLDNNELDKWFILQPQFLTAQRFTMNSAIVNPIAVADNMHENTDDDTNESTANANFFSQEQATSLSQQGSLVANQYQQPPIFDPYWYELTQFTADHKALAKDIQQATPNYLKAIGRANENVQQNHHNDLLIFSAMPAITLPHQRWLLQLAKIADIYLSRNRLRITSEPIDQPTKPLVSIGLLESNSDSTTATTNKNAVKKEEETFPLWKNPIILILIVVIGSLSALATLKYQAQKSKGVIPATETVLEQEHAKELKQQNKTIEK